MPNRSKSKVRSKLPKGSTEPVRVRSGMTTAQVTLSTAAQVVFAADTTQGVVTGAGGDGLGFRELRNLDASIDIYIGPDNTVTTLTGHKVPAGATFQPVANSGRVYVGAVYAIAASGTPKVSTIQW